MQPGDTETNFNITYTKSGGQCSLQPFDDATTYGKSFKSKILPIEGIDLLSNANGHDTAGTILTGSQIDASGKKPKNSSLDQFLAVERKLGASTPVTSIALGVGNDSTESGSTLSYGPGGAAAAQDHRPGSGVQHAVRQLRPQQRSGRAGGGDAPARARHQRGRLRDGRRQPALSAARRRRSSRSSISTSIRCAISRSSSSRP